MKINKKKSSKKILLKISILIGLIGLTLVVLEKLQITNFISQPQASESTTNQTQTINNNPPTPEQKTAGELQKKTANGTTQNNDLGISITSVNTSGDPVQIRSIISGAISDSGTCSLTLAQGNTTVTKTATTSAMPSSSTCSGFDIARSELSVGEWQLGLTVNINSKESSVTSDFSLE